MNHRYVPVVLVFFMLSAVAQSHRPGNPRGYTPDALLDVFKLTQADSDVPLATLMQACPERDCIVAIDEPVFVPAAEVDYLREDDLLLTVTIGDTTRAYPTRILDHHEIVNDVIAGVPVAVTYCPLCGSGLAFERKRYAQTMTFGVSSLLHNSDLVMYDRETETLWQQITGKAIAGKLRGKRLKSLPVGMVAWKEWAALHPRAGVLRVEGVHAARYTTDAYDGYAESDKLYMPVSATDARLHPKRVVYALEIGEQALAIDGEWLAGQGRWSGEVNGQKLVVSMRQDGEVTATLDDDTLTITRLYWFAWYSFHPRTVLIGGTSQE